MVQNKTEKLFRSLLSPPPSTRTLTENPWISFDPGILDSCPIARSSERSLLPGSDTLLRRKRARIEQTALFFLTRSGVRVVGIGPIRH
jgi:hypothetical protein